MVHKGVRGKTKEKEEGEGRECEKSARWSTLDRGRRLALPEVTVVRTVNAAGRVIDVGRVGRVGVDVVLVDRRTAVRLVDARRVVHEGSGRADGRRGTVRVRRVVVVVLGRRHGGDVGKVLVASGALSARARKAHRHGREQLASGRGDDEPNLTRDADVRVGEAEAVDAVAGDDEETEVEL